MSDRRYELIVVGGGPAGLTSGIYSGRNGLETLILEGEALGGKAAEAPLIDNYPGLEEISGFELAERMRRHASKYADIEEGLPVEEIERGELMRAITAEGGYEADALLIATGTEYSKLGVPGEEEFSDRGVSYCAVCDGSFFEGKSVVVVGGGNSALADASYLLDLDCDVKLVHRRGELRAEKMLRETFLERGGDIIWNATVERIEGDEVVEAVRLRDLESGSSMEVSVDGVFISVGDEPRTELADQIGVELDSEGYIDADEWQRTNVSGVYAAGDVTGEPKQVVEACSEGAKAALSAYADLKNPYWME